MRYNQLIKGIPKVSELGMGTWQLGASSDWKSISEKKSVDLVHQALDMGINFFDTAPNYGHGTSEIRLGRALRGKERSKVVINTKFGHTSKGKINHDAENIRESLEGSLRRLGTDYVDSFIFHSPPFEYLNGNKNDHYEILEKLKEEGMIRAYGASVDSAREMILLMETTGSEVIEAFFNILHQNVAEAFDLVREKQVGLIAKIPMDSGWLSGKYNENSRFEGIRSRWTKDDIRTRAKLVDRLKTILGDRLDLVSAALSFCLAYDTISTVIPGITDGDHLKKNLKSLSNPMPEDLLKDLEAFYQEEVKDLQIPW